jgi:DNA-binding NtrC family response regulator
MHPAPDLITIDFSLPDMSGDQLYQKIREQNPEIPVIVISSQKDIKVAVNLLKMGVKDYLVKDDSSKELLWNSIMRIRENQKLKKEVEVLREELGQKYSFSRTIIGQSESLKKVFSMMEKAINTKINVSILGETGTGKEVVAKAIHYNSDRRKKKFVAVNVAAIPSGLIESELFGHEKGAFTGSVGRKLGCFEEADGGTLFLDEIAEMDLNVQTKLLRVLQERELTRVGGNEVIKLDVRLIVATHKNLTEVVNNGLFRQDLFYRIMGIPVELPPLRERGNDILILARHFVDDMSKDNNLGEISLTQEAMDKLMQYNFPGNVRELKATMELATIMSNGGEIGAEDIQFNSPKKEDIFFGEKKTLKAHNCDIIRYYLKIYDGNIAETASQLDIGVSTIYKMLKLKEIVL